MKNLKHDTMKIRKKSTGKTLDVSEYAWQRMKHDGTAKKYEPVKPIAKEIKILSLGDPEQATIGGMAEEDDEPTREEMIENLRGMGIFVPHNIGDKTLKQKYYEAD